MYVIDYFLKVKSSLHIVDIIINFTRMYDNYWESELIFIYLY